MKHTLGTVLKYLKTYSRTDPFNKKEIVMNLLVTRGWYESIDHLDEMREMGYNVFYMAKESDELPCDPSIIDGVVCCRVFHWHPIEQFTRLKFIQTESVGYDRVPTEYCRAHKIAVHNAGISYAEPMSEYILAHILEWYQNIRQEHENRAARTFIRNHDKLELAGRTVCIIGTGNIARYTARKLAAFDCHIIGVTHTIRAIENFNEVVDYAGLNDALAAADIVIMAAPPTGRPVLGADEFNIMKESAVLVNVSRGTELDQTALVAALSAHSIAAAILDVMDPEPLDPSNELWTLDNAIITPHSSYIGDGNAERLWQTVRTTLQQFATTGQT